MEQTIAQSIDIHTVITQYKLFFIHFCFPGTLWQKWLLIRVDLESSNDLKINSESTILYYCIAFSKHNGEKITKLVDGGLGKQILFQAH